MDTTMDAGTTERLDAIVEAELVIGKKELQVPATIRRQCIAEGLGDLPRLQLVRLNPARRRQAAELVQRRYFQDMRDESLPSEAEIRTRAAKRGEWTAEHEARRTTLGEQSQRLMVGLYADGFAKGSEEWVARIQSMASTIRTSMGADHPQLALFDTWYQFVPGQDPENTFSPDSALQQLFDALPEHTELLEQIDDLKDRVARYWQLVEVRTELNALELRRSRVFDQTVESRRDQTEEWARLYVTARRIDEQGEDLGPLATTFDGLLEYPTEVLQYLTSESYLFQSGIPDAAREYLEVFGFLAPTSDSSASTPSDESPDAATPNSAGDAVTAVPSSSSESATATTLTTSS